MTTNLDQEARPRLCAAVLAGGRSSRMGEDKALLRLAPDRPTLLELTIQRVSAVAGPVIVVAPDERDYGRFRVETIPDDAPGQGVLGGIATALRHFGDADVLVVACDHPFLNVPLLQHMAEIADDCDVVIPRTLGESRQGGAYTLQTLHAIYRASCWKPLIDVLAGGYSSAMDFFERVRIRPIDEPELRRFDPNLNSLASVNTPGALARARQAASRGDWA